MLLCLSNIGKVMASSFRFVLMKNEIKGRDGYNIHLIMTVSLLVDFCTGKFAVTCARDLRSLGDIVIIMFSCDHRVSDNLGIHFFLSHGFSPQIMIFFL